TFTLGHHSYFKTTIQGGKYGDYPYERIDRSYLLIKEPLHSKLASSGLRKFVKQHRINSILFVPLKINSTVRHLLTFFGSDRKQAFSDEEIELLVFFGKEVMKASRLEFLGDMLHDFKNPAVAVAGLAARARKLLHEDDLNKVRDKLVTLLDVVADEGARLQDVALTITGEGHESLIDLGLIAAQRYQLNEAVIHETGRVGVETKPVKKEEGLLVLCPRPGLTRVIDNLLHNATKAIPASGGFLAMRCRRDKKMVRLEIENSGSMGSEMIARIKRGEAKGRGFNIIHRFVQANHGALGIRVKKNSIVIIIKLPLQSSTTQ
ncbi:MAG: GHKL domain-containing protein, partial [Desulfobulbaceae bacterium]|nr:GHKL domain-containing protein [Desulfobulbaceae bacterium]